MAQLSKILTGKSNPTIKEIEVIKNNFLNYKIDGGDEDDLIIVSKKVGIIYVDKGLKKIHKRILKGRRCFRTHFINAVELAYVTDLLIKEYNNYFNRILEEIETLQLDKSWPSKFKQLMTANILEPCAYSTLVHPFEQ